MGKAALGIDVSKKTLDCVLITAEGKSYHKKVSNTKEGMEELVEWHARRKSSDTHFCMEATGGYGDAAATFLHDNGFRVSVVNPARIRGFAQSELSRNKTDKADAALIARFCQAMNPEPWHPEPRRVRELRAMARRLDSLIEMRGQEENRLENVEEIVAKRIRGHIEYLDAEIKRLKSDIADYIDNDPEMRGKRELLESITGVGPATIATVLSEFGDVERFKSAKQLAAFIGVSPKRRESGTSVRGRTVMSKIGNSKVRKSLFMPAIVALNKNEAFVAFKKRLLEAGKPKMLIVGAAMRKLVHVIYGVLKSGKPFDPKLAMGS